MGRILHPSYVVFVFDECILVYDFCIYIFFKQYWTRVIVEKSFFYPRTTMQVYAGNVNLEFFFFFFFLRYFEIFSLTLC